MQFRTLLLLAAAAAATPTPEPQLGDQLNDLVNSITGSFNLDDIAQGILPDFFNWTIDQNEIKDRLGITDLDLDNVETHVLNLPAYANYTNDGWMVRFHAQAYKEALAPNSPVDNSTLDDAANIFLPDFDIRDLEPHEQDNARNLTSAILSIPQSDIGIAFDLSVPENSRFSSDWRARIVWPKKTSTFGEVDGFVPLPQRNADDLPDGTNQYGIVRLDMHTNVSSTGNASAYLVPTRGVTIVSDVDDVLRVTRIYQPKEGLLNTFARDFRPWENMPEVYAEWSEQHPDTPYHFHYLTTTPQPATRTYEEFVYTYYPLGSFDTRPYNFTDLSATFSIREHLLRKVIQTFPERQFVLVGDTSNSDALKGYPLMAREYDNVQCILIRDTAATDDMNLPYNTKDFESLPEDKYMFFVTPDDLIGLDFGNGDCRNRSVKQPTEFGWKLGSPVTDGNVQNSGSGGGSGDNGGAAGRVTLGAWTAVVVGAAMWVLA